MKPGSVVMLIIGTLFSVLGLGLLTGGAVAAAANAAQQNNGYLQTPTGTFTVNSYALTSPRERGMPTVLPVNVASIRLRAASAQAGKDIFIGIAPQADVDRYLAGVHHTELTNGAFSPFRAEYRDVAGTTVPTSPADQTWWSVSATGPGTQEIVWELQSGSWAVVIMNADASPSVAVDMQAGVRSDLIWFVALGLLTGGGILLLIGLFLVVAGAIGLGRSGPQPARGPGQPAQPGAAPLAAPGTAPPGPATPEAGPTRLDSTASSTPRCPGGCGWSSGSWPSPTSSCSPSSGSPSRSPRSWPDSPYSSPAGTRRRSSPSYADIGIMPMKVALVSEIPVLGGFCAGNPHFVSA